MSSPIRLLAKLCTAALLAGTALPAKAGGSQGVLVELFTSQGCSSCPPADRLLGRLARRSDVVALSLHVTYWDYLGWRDTFARDEYTRRQIAYRDAMGSRVIYTPQMVVQGAEDVPPARRDAIDGLVKAAAKATTIGIEIGMSAGRLAARLLPAPKPVGGRIWVATYRRMVEVEIGRGENAGAEIEYHNVVDSLMTHGDWDGTAERSVELPQPAPHEGVAIWVQDGAAGPVRAAAKYEH